MIREILLYIEKETKYIETENKRYERIFGSAKELNSAPISLFKFVDEGKCSSIPEALYILRKLEDGGYIITTESNKTPEEKASSFPLIKKERDSEELKSDFFVLDITFKGIEFLNLIRDDIIWNKYKSVLPVGSFEIITQMIPKIAIKYYL
ncbi:MAG: DUF2513 domain-containing protein [Ruminococcus sp.]|nr:DUF2513 domain-containing protein [Ruminococcus sp.]